MAGFITIEDGRAYARSNWAYDTAVDAIARHLPSTPLAIAFRDWLLEQRCYDRDSGTAIRGSGLGSVDLRELAPVCRELFWSAARDAYTFSEQDGGASWSNPDGFSDWLKSFAELLFLHETYADGQPPPEFNPHMNGLMPPTTDRVGPGW